MLKIIFLLAVVFVMAKDPVSLQPDIQTPDINKKDEIDLKKYKDVELKKEDTKGQPLCTSEAGVEYKPGTES